MLRMRHGECVCVCGVCVTQGAHCSCRAPLDIADGNFWGRDWNYAFFDTSVFSSFAQSHWNTSLSACYNKFEQEKKRAYDKHVREVEHGSLVFSTSGGMGPTANVVYKRIASMILPRNMTRHIQQDPPWDQMEIELLTLALSNYMPKRSKIQHSSPCNIPRHNGPSLGPSTVNIDITYQTPCI